MMFQFRWFLHKAFLCENQTSVILFGQGDSVHLCAIIANCGEELLSRGNSTPYKVQRDECEESVGGGGE